MQLSVLFFTTVFGSAYVAAASFRWPAQSQVVLDDKLKVPGNNTLFFCEDPKDDLVEIKNVDLDPNPPTAGSELKIFASGTVKETIEKGAKVHLQVKYGLITLINQDADLCDKIANVDLECPLEKGDMKVKKTVKLPREIPPGKYFVRADVHNKDKKRVTCLTSEIHFSS